MPLTEKGSKILANFKKQYGEEKGERYFYAAKNKGTITGVDSADEGTSEGAKKAALTRKQHGVKPPAPPGSTKLSAHEAGNQVRYIPNRTGNSPPKSLSPSRTRPQKQPSEKPKPVYSGKSTSGIKHTTSIIRKVSEGMERRARGLDADTSVSGQSPPKVEAAKPSESKASETVVESATPPQNNLNLPPQTPGKSIPLNDSIRQMNIRNRDFWSRQPRR